MEFYFSGNGRVSRKAFWLRWILPYVGLSIAAGVIDALALSDMTERMVAMGGSGPIATILGFILIWPSFAVSAKRFHDRGMSGWWPLYLLLIYLGLLIVIIVGVIMSGIDPTVLETGGTPDFANANTVGIGIAAVGILAMVGVGIWSLIVQGFLPGQQGPNQYGPDPLRPELGQPA